MNIPTRKGCLLKMGSLTVNLRTTVSYRYAFREYAPNHYDGCESFYHIVVTGFQGKSVLLSTPDGMSLDEELRYCKMVIELMDEYFLELGEVRLK